MNDLAIFSIGFDRSRWLAARAAATAANVANADTPGYKARDVAPFEAMMKSLSVSLGRTSAGHLTDPAASSRKYEMVPRATSGEKHSGNSVSLETEMASLGQTRGQQSLVTGILSAFHRMLISSAKG